MRRTVRGASLVVSMALAATAAASPWGDHAIGFMKESVVDGTTGRAIDVMIFYPAAGSGPAATYDRLLIPDAVAGWVELGALTGFGPPYFTGDDYAPFADGHTAHGGVAVAAGAHPAIINLPGGNAPGFIALTKGLIEASRGYLVFNVTHRYAPPTPAGRCLLERDALAVVDAVRAWNQDAGHPLHGAVDEDALFGTGYSLGGRTWIARTSEVQLCGLERETRVRALSVQDATWERTTLEQTTGNHTPIVLQSQWCRFTQMKLQLELPTAPARVDLEGWGVIDPIVNPSPVPLGQGPAASHSLFATNCSIRGAMLNAGHPLPPPPPPFAPSYLCAHPETLAREHHHALAVTTYGLAFFEHLFAHAPRKAFAPGRAMDGAYVLQRPAEQTIEGGFVNDCRGVPGEDPDEPAPVAFGAANLPPRFP